MTRDDGRDVVRAPGTRPGALGGRGVRPRASSWLSRPRLLYSVRGRLTLWYLSLMAVVLLLFSGAIYAIDQQYLTTQLDNRVHARLQQLAGTYDPRTRRLLLSQDAAKQQAGEMILLMTPQGGVLQTQAPGALPAKERALLVTQALNVAAKATQSPIGFDQTLTLWLPTGTPRTTLYRVSSMPIRTGGHVAAVLVVGRPSDVPPQMAALSRALLIVAPLVLLLCGGSGYWLASRAMHPVRAITRTARQIGETDLSRRLNVPRGDELGELGATLDGMLERLETAFARQRQFTADASHELRTPLAIVDLVATRALGQPRTPEEYRRALAVVRQENAYMARLVDDLLLLARADRGQDVLRREEVDMGEIVLDVVERLAPLAEQQRMAVDLGAVPELPVRGDRHYLTRMVTNIAENALKHGSEGGDRVRIDLTEDQCDGIRWACVRVRDNGPGITAEHLPRLFDRFYRADRARTRSREGAGETDGASRSTGSGLGLAIARWIAQAHQGDIQVESEAGQGTVFEIRLPVLEATSRNPGVLGAPMEHDRRET